MGVEKFDIGMELIESIMRYRRRFEQHNPQDPAKALQIVLSHEAHDAVVMTLTDRHAAMATVDLKAFWPVVALVGIPVRVDPNVRIMHIHVVKNTDQ